MKIEMNDLHITTISQLSRVLKGTQRLGITLRDSNVQDKYNFIDKRVDRFQYKTLHRREKRILVKYLKKVTGYKHAQIHRLIKRAVLGDLKRKKYKRKNPKKKYSSYDVKLLEKTDEVHKRLSTNATKKILEREVSKFGRHEYSNIAEASPAHIHNLRRHPVYQNIWINHTKARQSDIGETRKPDNRSQPGLFRIDTVHQQDVYHINAVDDFLQWEVVVTVPEITMRYMEFVFWEIEDQVPYVIFGAHVDRGGEYINRRVAEIVEKMGLDFTKSRAHKSNDNALVECKNGSVIRKNFGFGHVNQETADKHNEFNRKFFNPYLNFHRPCAYPEEEMDSRGKIKKHYKFEDYEVPYEKLKQISKELHTNFLKPGITFKELDIIAYAKSDNQFAEEMRTEQMKLSKLLRSKV